MRSKTLAIEDTELNIGGVKLRGVYIAIVVSMATTIGGGIWAVAEFYGRIEAVEEATSGNGATTEKLTVLGTNLETIMENQRELLDMRDRIAEVEKTSAENDVLVQQFKTTVDGIDKSFEKINREIDDIWRGLDAASNPLR
jgi:septation ring formation regulator EzrA